MKKEDFLIQFVLNRALCNPYLKHGDESAEMALKAWKVIERESAEENRPLT